MTEQEKQALRHALKYLLESGIRTAKASAKDAIKAGIGLGGGSSLNADEHGFMYFFYRANGNICISTKGFLKDVIIKPRQYMPIAEQLWEEMHPPKPAPPKAPEPGTQLKLF